MPEPSVTDWILAVLGGVAVVYTHRQVRLLKQQVIDAAATLKLAEKNSDDQTRSARESAVLAERSAKASELSAQTAKNALEVNSRPWVMFDKIDVFARLNNKFPIGIKVHLSNVGNTPAIEMKAMAEVHLSDLVINDATEFKKEFGSNASVGVLLNQPWNLNPIEVKYTEEQVSKVLSGEMWLYLYGCATYSDVFGKVHETHICMTYVPAQQTFAYEKFGNSAT